MKRETVTPKSNATDLPALIPVHIGDEHGTLLWVPRRAVLEGLFSHMDSFGVDAVEVFPEAGKVLRVSRGSVPPKKKAVRRG